MRTRGLKLIPKDRDLRRRPAGSAGKQAYLQMVALKRGADAVTDGLTSVPIAPAGDAVVCLQRDRLIIRPFADVIARLRAAIVETDLWLLHEIDPQALLRKSGFAIPAARQLLFFHPRLMVRLLAGDGAAILEVPLKFAVLEEEHCTRLRWLDPIVSFARYDNVGLAELGETLAAEFERIVARVVEDDLITPDRGLALV